MLKSKIVLALMSVMLIGFLAGNCFAKPPLYWVNAQQGDPTAIYDVADSILNAKDNSMSMEKFAKDEWGGTLLLKYSMDKGNKKAASKLKDLHGTLGQAYVFLLKGVLNNCNGNECQPFAENKKNPAKSIYRPSPGVCNARGDDSNEPNQYENGTLDYFCVDKLSDLKSNLASLIADNATDLTPKDLAELYLSLDQDAQTKMAPAIGKEAADIVAKRFFADKNFTLAKYWYQKANNASGLAEVERREKEISDYQDSKRKAEAEALAAKENAEKKKIADETARREAQQKAEVDRQSMEQRVALEKQSADQKLALQRQESEKRLAEERAAGEKRLAEERSTVLAESERSRIEGLKTGSIQVTNLKDAVLKFDAKDGSQLVKQPPLSTQDGYWALRGDLRSVETEVKGQSGNVFVCSGQHGTFAFVTDKPAERLKINQRLGIVGRHVATEPASSTNGAVVYIPIFKAVEVVDE